MENQLKIQADELLVSTCILEILSKFGEVHIVGSYAFNMMTEPDIDLIIITDTPKESSEEAAQYIIKEHLFQKIEYGDFEKFPRENRPPFFILNMRTLWWNKTFEIEAWFVPNAKEKLDFVEMMNGITQEQKDEIIKLKLERKNKNLSKNNLSSFSIYKKVLGF